MFFFFISLNVPLWSACKYLWWRLVLCGDQTIDLQGELIGWFLYGLGFCPGYFWTDYSIVLILEGDIAKCLFVFITAAMSFCWFFRLLACSLLKSSFAKKKCVFNNFGKLSHIITITASKKIYIYMCVCVCVCHVFVYIYVIILDLGCCNMDSNSDYLKLQCIKFSCFWQYQKQIK